MKDEIKSKEDMIVLVDQKGVLEPSIVFCDKIKYIRDKSKDGKFFDHHLMFWKDSALVYKVYLKNKPKDNEYKSVKDAMTAVGMRLVVPIGELMRKRR